jgi:superfamily II DNA helicase RecQ
MGSLRRSYRKAVSNLKLLFVVLLVLAGIAQYLSTSPFAQHLWIVPALATVALILAITRFIFKTKNEEQKYINQNGYYVLSRNGELEHRQIAIDLLGRALFENEVVHHINGQKLDNQIRNLCLMDREKHELFHSWLRWKKEKSGYYPRFKDQIRILRDEYGGTPLTDIPPPQQTADFRPVIEQASENEIPWGSVWNPWRKTDAPQVATKLIPKKKIELDPEQKKKLFVLLREERSRLAEERNRKAYLIFHDKTLIEMSERLPDSKHAMLEIGDVTPEKYETYGAQFIFVIRKFKEDLDEEK